MEHIPDSNNSPVEFSGGSFTPPGTPPPLSAGSFTPPATPPPLSPSHPLFLRNQQMVEDSDVDGESMEEDPEEELRRQIRDMIQNFDDSDEPYLLFQVDGERVLAPGETSEGAINSIKQAAGLIASERDAM
ncbi:hypothetical protein PGT21_017901 [Puccinia graminis f. sp. tritici]|uniref:Uncharacterized protein n=1 Tax=Puccinia graminis f. sp. tritici TaxID=56615 RepID=A0A5B0Q350_PUCGR|nr:hypothetical protein PGT21_017901 [Puccinia graminis f. sp. tritici]